MANGKQWKTERTMNTRTVEKTFKIKPGEQLTDIKISLGSVPVGGSGPRPKKQVLLTAFFAQIGETVAKPKHVNLAPKAKAMAAKAKKAKKAKKKPVATAPDKPQTPVGGVGRKRRVVKP